MPAGPQLLRTRIDRPVHGRAVRPGSDSTSFRVFPARNGTGAGTPEPRARDGV
jgi:hypothetical protein